MADVRATTLHIVVESPDAAAWVFFEEILLATMAAAVSLWLFPEPGGGRPQTGSCLCLCLLTGSGVFAHHLSRWTAGEHRSRSP
jgi:hypothetical protein